MCGYYILFVMGERVVNGVNLKLNFCDYRPLRINNNFENKQDLYHYFFDCTYPK